MRIVEKFANWLLRDGKAPKTIENYTIETKVFLKYYQRKNDKEISKLNRKNIVNYKQYLLNSGYAVGSINKKISSLYSFNQFLIEEEKIEEMIVLPKKDRIKIAMGTRKNIEVFSEEESEAILNYVEKKEVSLRNRMIVHILFYTGASKQFNYL